MRGDDVFGPAVKLWRGLDIIQQSQGQNGFSFQLPFFSQSFAELYDVLKVCHHYGALA